MAPSSTITLIGGKSFEIPADLSDAGDVARYARDILQLSERDLAGCRVDLYERPSPRNVTGHRHYDGSSFVRLFREAPLAPQFPRWEGEGNSRILNFDTLSSIPPEDLPDAVHQSTCNVIGADLIQRFTHRDPNTQLTSVDTAGLFAAIDRLSDTQEVQYSNRYGLSPQDPNDRQTHFVKNVRAGVLEFLTCQGLSDAAHPISPDRRFPHWDGSGTDRILNFGPVSMSPTMLGSSIFQGTVEVIGKDLIQRHTHEGPNGRPSLDTAGLFAELERMPDSQRVCLVPRFGLREGEHGDSRFDTVSNLRAGVLGYFESQGILPPSAAVVSAVPNRI